MMSSSGDNRPLRKSDDVNHGMPIGLLTDWGGLGKEANMVWEPKDEYATCPPCQQDEKGRYFFAYEGREDDGNWAYANRIMIDTRIPVEARKPMSLGVKPVLTYQEWLEAENGEGQS